MSITLDFIRNEIEKQSYEISLHADDERIADELTVSQLEFILLQCKIIEQYPDDPRGESCLTVGFTSEGTPVHIACGKNPSGHLILLPFISQLCQNGKICIQGINDCSNGGIGLW